ncbi:hypothetical protein BDL97_08G064300 [Sphagnum fallax]|nr:hypothetical protein BDL97_08G064300 [Sphagnum fallax]
MAVKWPAISVSLILLCVELLSLTSGGLAVAVTPSNWELCDKSAKYDVEVKNITIEPYPAVSGEDVTFIVPAIANQEITTAFVVVTVSFHGIPVHVERNDICSKLKCPIGPGSFTLENTEPLPRITPPGSYNIKLQFLDGDDSILACAEVKFTIVWGKHLETTLESLNSLQSGS